MNRSRALVIEGLLLVFCFGALAADTPPSPDEFLGFPVGADRMLADYDQIGDYFKALADASDRVDLEEIGKSVQGRPLWMAVISSPDNLRNAAELKSMAHKLADPRGLRQNEIDQLAQAGKAIVLVTCTIHSTEIASSQMAMELAWELAITDDPRWKAILENVVLLLAPSINPDGQQMIVDWYRKHVGTDYEGGRMPWLYHHYAGHDNNRDWFMLNLPETRAVNRVLYHDWFPQVYLDIHQMGSTGPRMFVPPFQDPIASNIHPLVWRLSDLFGTEMAVRLQQDGRSGVIDHFAYDGYWPGGTMNTAWWKNVVGLLTESASVQIASPVRIEENELRGNRKGLAEYRKQVNFPDPWPGGWWRMRDIIDYQLISTKAVLETASRYREDLLRDISRMAQDAVRKGKTTAPYAYAIPPEQRDPITTARLVDLLLENAIEVHQSAEGFQAGRRRFPPGTLVVSMDQPYRAFAKELLEVQRFPEIRPASGLEILRPYDVTGWTLPLQMGVEGEWIELPFETRLTRLEEAPYPRGTVSGQGKVFLLGRETNASALAVNRLLEAKAELRIAEEPFEAADQHWPAGTYIVRKASRSVEAIAKETHVTFQALSEPPSVTGPRLRQPRIGLYKPWTVSMDEGWTRLVLENFGFGFTSLDNKTIQSGGLAGTFDVIVLPDMSKELLLDGRTGRVEGKPPRYVTPLPPDYQGGLGEEGAEALEEFVEAGGTLVALDSAASLLLARMNLPVRDAVQELPADRFLCPGSLLKVLVDPSHPLGYGLPEEVAGYFARSPAFATSIPGSERTRQVVARYPAEGPVLLSGWIRGEEHLRRRAAVVDIGVGKGRVVLLGFRVQHRAQPHGTFRFLFNALERAGWEIGS